MFRTAYVVLSVLALTIIVAAGNPAKAGGYYEGDGYYNGYRSGYYGDRHYSGYRSSSYHSGHSWSDCCYRKVARYERINRDRDDSYYERPYRRSYSRPYYTDSYSRPYDRSAYYARPRYDSSYTTGYYSGYGAYDSAYKCTPRRIRDIDGGWIWTARAGCPNVN